MREIDLAGRALSELSPPALERYLSLRGWQEFTRITGRVSIWDNYHDEVQKRFRIWLPLVHDLADFLPTMHRVVRTLAIFEDRSQLEMLEDLRILAIGDIVRVKFRDTMHPTEDTLPLENGLRLVMSARDMASAAACSTVQPKAVLPSRRPNQALEYMEKVELGQTERGSFVVKLISPLPFEEPRQLSLLESAERQPFERQVIYTLLKSLKALKDAAMVSEERERFSFEPFKEAVPDGVSANLCEALVRNKRDGRYFPLEVSVSWSYTLDPTLEIEGVLFPEPLMPHIAEAARLLREETWDEIELQGYVIRLHREQTRGRGGVTIFCLLEDIERKVSVELEEEDYQTAIRAHEYGFQVSCKGKLERRGTKFTLVDLVSFRILEP